jgi:hypothetical protein
MRCSRTKWLGLGVRKDREVWRCSSVSSRGCVFLIVLVNISWSESKKEKKCSGRLWLKLGFNHRVLYYGIVPDDVCWLVVWLVSFRTAVIKVERTAAMYSALLAEKWEERRERHEQWTSWLPHELLNSSANYQQLIQVLASWIRPSFEIDNAIHVNC